ncbi:hypothetical protein SMICM17S_07493 [Streptomyces microflavus]
MYIRLRRRISERSQGVAFVGFGGAPVQLLAQPLRPFVDVELGQHPVDLGEQDGPVQLPLARMLLDVLQEQVGHPVTGGSAAGERLADTVLRRPRRRRRARW